MTIAQVFGVFRRQWHVLLLGLVLTSVLAAAASRTQTVYWSQTTVRFVATSGPESGIEANKLVTTSEELIAFTGLVLADLSLPPAPPVSSLKPTIIDTGTYDGVWVRLPDTGGQWSHVYGDAYLDVQVAGPTPESVRVRTEATVESIRRAAIRRLALQSGRTSSVETRPTPPIPVVVQASAGSSKPFLATFALGVSTTVALALGLDLRRRTTHAAKDVPPPVVSPAALIR